MLLMSFLNFAKAFDTVPHKHPMQELRIQELLENVFQWVAKRLKEGRKGVLVNKTSSK